MLAARCPPTVPVAQETLATLDGAPTGTGPSMVVVSRTSAWESSIRMVDASFATNLASWLRISASLDEPPLLLRELPSD